MSSRYTLFIFFLITSLISPITFATSVLTVPTSTPSSPILNSETNPKLPPAVELGLAVLDKINADKRMAGSHIGASVLQGEVTLTGTVANHDQINIALEIAKSISGVKLAKSTLTVKDN